MHLPTRSNGFFPGSSPLPASKVPTRPRGARSGARRSTSPCPRPAQGARPFSRRCARSSLRTASGLGRPGFSGWVTTMPTTVPVVAQLAGALVAAQRWWASPGNFLEVLALRWLARLVGLPDHFEGSFTSGGATANLLGLAAARQHAGESRGFDPGLDGLARLAAPRVYASTEVHHVVLRACGVLGLGRRALRMVPVDARRQPDLRVLERFLDEDLAAGRTPVAVVASAGDVNTGIVDPIDAMREIAHARGVWLHVDGAYGGFGVLDPRVAPLYGGPLEDRFVRGGPAQVDGRARGLRSGFRARRRTPRALSHAGAGRLCGDGADGHGRRPFAVRRARRGQSRLLSGPLGARARPHRVGRAEGDRRLRHARTRRASPRLRAARCLTRERTSRARAPRRARSLHLLLSREAEGRFGRIGARRAERGGPPRRPGARPRHPEPHARRRPLRAPPVLHQPPHDPRGCRRHGGRSARGGGGARRDPGVKACYSASRAFFAPASSRSFSGLTSGYRRSSESSASITAAATTTRVNHLLSAGTTYQGDSSVEVSRIISSYASM